MQSNQNQNSEITAAKSQEKKVIIHTMPKRFIGARVVIKGHKGIGVFILLIGVLLMAGAIAVFYYFIIKPQPEPITGYTQEIDEIIEQESTGFLAPSISEENAIDDEEEKIAEIESIPVEEDIKEININDLATSTEIASGTDIIAEKPTSSVKVPALDSDQDGMGDMEEILLDCNINNRDSDNDGYSDYDELLKLYNPAGAGKLIVNPNIEKYTNNSYRYSLYYPNTWLKTNVDAENSILFQAGNNQFIQIIIQDNVSGKNLDDWYMELMGANEIKGEQRLYKAGWSGIKSSDGLTVYLSNPNSEAVFTISYNTGMDDTLVYFTIFQMMVESFALVN